MGWVPSARAIAARTLRRERRIAAMSILGVALLFGALALWLYPFRTHSEWLHVSFDTYREFYQALNSAYLAQEPNPSPRRILMSPAGSTRQAANLEGRICNFTTRSKVSESSLSMAFDPGFPSREEDHPSQSLQAPRATKLW